MKHHKVTTTINQELRETLLDQIQTLADAVPVKVTIPPGQQRRMAKMGARSRPFVEDAISLATKHAEMLPRTHDAASLRAKLDTVEALREITSAVRTLKGQLEESLTVAGAELYEDARLIYALSKTALRPAGSAHATNNLAKRFKARPAGASEAESKKTESSGAVPEEIAKDETPKAA